MSDHRVIVAGASAGGVEAYIRFVGGLPSDFAAAVFLVLHIPSEFPSFLADILRSKTHLKVLPTEDGAPVTSGEIRVAPPGFHTLIQSGRMMLVRGPRENRHRPAVDPLFRSAASEYGPRAIGIILTGTLDDGTAGLFEIKRRGGIAIVQDPADAEQASMPASALSSVDVDYCLPLARIPTLLSELVQRPLSESPPAVSCSNGHHTKPAPPKVPRAPGPRTPVPQHEIKVAAGDIVETFSDHRQPGSPSVYTCPECQGVLWEVQEGGLLRFRCRVGHAYSLDTISVGQAEALEAALWNAMKILEENVSVCRRLVQRAQEKNLAFLVNQYQARIRKAEEQMKILKRVLLSGPGTFPDFANSKEMAHGEAEAS